MKTNNIVINSIMRKCICTVLITLYASLSAWGATYQRVTDWSELSTGDVVIFANSGKTGSVYVMGTTLSSNKYAGVSATVSSDGQITTTSAKEMTVKFNGGDTKQAVAFCTGTGGSELYPESYWLGSTGDNNKITTVTVENTFAGTSVSNGNTKRYCWKTNGTFTNHSAYCVNMQNTTDDALYLKYNSGFCASSTGSAWYVAIFKKTCTSPFGTLSVGGGATINNYNGVTTDKSVSLAGKQGSGTVTWSLVNVPSSVATIPSSGASSATVRITGTGGQQSYTITVKCHIAASGDYCEEEQTIDITVNAKSYTYTYKPNGATGSDQTQTVYHGVSTSLKGSSAFTAPSCKQFSEWNTSSSGSNTPHYSAGQSVTPEGALTLYAIWSDLGPYTVTATSSPAAGGTATIGGESSKSCACGATGIALVATPNSGYYFNGWTKSPNTSAGGTIADASSASTTYSTGTAAATLTANFLPYLHVTYNANGGSGAPTDANNYVKNANVSISNSIPTNSGYTFRGWATSSANATAGIVAYTQNQSNAFQITADTELWAVWCKTITGASLTVSGTTPTFSYSTGKGTCTFSWGSVTGATAYNLTIRNTTDGTDVYSGAVAVSSSYEFTNMIPGKTYRATVTASNACTETSGYVEKSIDCPAMAGTPTITLPGTIGKTSVTIEFSQTNAVSFNVWLTNGDGSSDLGTIAVAAEEIAATNGEASKTFTISADQYYYVHATGKNICGSVSSENSDDFQAGHEATWDTYLFSCVTFGASVPSGKALITSGYDGSAAKTVLAKNPVRLSITGAIANHYVQIEPSDANVKVYFIKAGSPNKYQEVNGSNQLRIGNDGTFTKDIYFAYAPTAHGDGSVTAPTFTVRCDGFEETFNTDGSLLKVRALPENFAIIAKVGNTWDILPADMGNSNGTQPAVGVRVDNNTNPTIAYTEAADNAFRLWPIGGPTSVRFQTISDSVNGSMLRFSMPNNLYSSNALAFGASESSTSIGAFYNATLTESSSTIGAHFYWDVTTTEVVDGGNTYFKYNLKNPANSNFLTLSGKKWGMYGSGVQEVRFVKIEETKDAELTAMEWGVDQVVLRYSGSGTVALTSAAVDGEALGSAHMERIGSSDLYILSDVTLQSNPSKALQVVVDETVGLVTTSKESLFTIPFIISNGQTKNNSELRTAVGDNTSNAIIRYIDVVIRKGGKFETDATTEARFNDLFIYPGGKFEIPSASNNVSFQNVYLRGGFSWLSAEFSLPQMLIASGKAIEGPGSSGNGIYYDLYLNNSIYYMMALPKDVALNSVTNEDGDDDWTAWVKGYSGKPRSLNPANRGWSNVAGPNLERGKGYEIAIKPRKGRPYGTLRFPLMSSAWSDETAISPAVVAWGMTDGELDEGVTANNAGWNLIGNPFFTAYNNTIGEETIIIADSLTKKLDAGGNWTGAYEWVGTKVKYFTIPGYTTEDYKDVRSTPYKLDAFYPFFVQVNSGTEASPASLTFGTANRALKMPRRLTLQAEEREVNLDVQLSDELNHTDVMGLNINDEYSSAFDEEDKEKTILGGENYMKIYTLVGDYRVAFNSLSEAAAAQPIPVGVITPESGYYTIALVEDMDVSEVEHVWLWDYEKSSQIDLLVEDYLYYSTPGQLEDRFAINVVLKSNAPEITTGVDETTVNTDAEKPVKFIYHDQIYIMYRGVIYDITGRKVQINK